MRNVHDFDAMLDLLDFWHIKKGLYPSYSAKLLGHLLGAIIINKSIC